MMNNIQRAKNIEQNQKHVIFTLMTRSISAPEIQRCNLNPLHSRTRRVNPLTQHMPTGMINQVSLDQVVQCCSWIALQGINYLTSAGFFEKTTDDIVKFIKSTSSLNKTQLGDYLGDPRNLQVRLLLGSSVRSIDSCTVLTSYRTCRLDSRSCSRSKSFQSAIISLMNVSFSKSSAHCACCVLRFSTLTSRPSISMALNSTWRCASS